MDKGFDHFKVALSIGVQRMVRSDLACSGVMFTIDTETGFREAVMISAAYGLGENVVQGSVTPDEFLVFKPTLKTGHRPVLQKMVGSKEFKRVCDSVGAKMVKNIPVASADRGGRTCHAVIVSRELGVPAIVGIEALNLKPELRVHG